MNICVLGGGSFGTVLANIAAENGHQVNQWIRSQEQVEDMIQQGVNARYLPHMQLHPSLKPTSDLAHALQACEIIIVAIPSSAFRSAMQNAEPYIKPDQYIISATKGVEQGTTKLMSEILSEILPNNPIGVISGPNLAKELSEKQIAASVIASPHPELRTTFQQAMHNSYFRIYDNSDMFGVELAGAIKNIYAIAAGMCAALQMGENTKSMLLTRSLAEMSRFAVALGANPMTFIGLAGVGDLIVTCSSVLSRNYRVGLALGEGKTLEEAVTALGQVAEGVNTLRQIKQLAEDNEIYMPLVTALYDILFKGRDVQVAISRLMSRDHNSDVEFIVEANKPAATG